MVRVDVTQNNSQDVSSFKNIKVGDKTYTGTFGSPAVNLCVHLHHSYSTLEGVCPSLNTQNIAIMMKIKETLITKKCREVITLLAIHTVHR